MNLVTILFVIQSLLIVPAGKDDGVLPVELYYFFAEIKSDYVLLKWGTATEVDNYGFNLERSANLSEWVKLEFLPGYGTSNISRDYSYEDTTVVADSFYYYRLKQIDIIGSSAYSDTISIHFVTEINELSSFSEPKYYLYPSYPNPFNPSTKIKFNIAEQGIVNLTIFDILGRESSKLIDEELQPGTYEVEFNPKRHAELSSGIYFYRLSTKNFTDAKKFVILK
ncbi:MAG TPA: T9SS type A sorting domain-containing protein [Ignavibacteriaceae bacterium]